MSIKPVAVTAIFGMPMKKFSQKKPIAVLAKKLDRQATWNAGITPCDNQTLDMYERLYLSQKAISSMPLLHGSMLFVTTYHLLLNHYQIFNKESLDKF